MNKKFKRILKPLIVAGATIVMLTACSTTAQEADKPIIVFKENIVFEHYQTGVESKMISDVTRQASDSAPVNQIINPEPFIDKEQSQYDSVSFTPRKEEAKPAEGLNSSAITGQSSDAWGAYGRSYIHTDVVGSGFEVTVFARLGDKEVAYTMVYDVVDTRYPTIYLSQNTYQKGVGSDALILEALTVSDPIDGELVPLVDSSIDWNRVGTYDLKVTAEDSNGNVSHETFTITITD